MKDNVFVVLIAVMLIAAEVYGLYLAYQESSSTFLLALVIPPYAIFKGFIGFAGFF